jgi:hypothetical protein
MALSFVRGFDRDTKEASEFFVGRGSASSTMFVELAARQLAFEFE